MRAAAKTPGRSVSAAPISSPRELVWTPRPHLDKCPRDLHFSPTDFMELGVRGDREGLPDWRICMQAGEVIRETRPKSEK